MDQKDARTGMGRDAAWTVLSAAILLCPALASAQSSISPITTTLANRAAPKPPCVYKGVMSDAEVEACTGHRVTYDYRILYGKNAAPVR